MFKALFKYAFLFCLLIGGLVRFMPVKADSQTANAALFMQAFEAEMNFGYIPEPIGTQHFRSCMHGHHLNGGQGEEFLIEDVEEDDHKHHFQLNAQSRAFLTLLCNALTPITNEKAQFEDSQGIVSPHDCDASRRHLRYAVFLI